MKNNFKEIIYKYFGHNSSYWDEDFDNALVEIKGLFEKNNPLEQQVKPTLAENTARIKEVQQFYLALLLENDLQPHQHIIYHYAKDRLEKLGFWNFSKCSL